MPLEDAADNCLLQPGFAVPIPQFLWRHCTLLTKGLGFLPRGIYLKSCLPRIRLLSKRMMEYPQIPLFIYYGTPG